MMGIPLSWLIGGGLVAAISGYIAYLKWRRNRAEKRADQAIQERNNERVDHKVTKQAQSAEHAYHEAHDSELIFQEKQSKGKTLLEKINNLAPLFLCLVLVGSALPACAPGIHTVEVNPAERVIIPKADALEHWAFTEPRKGLYCMDESNTESLFRNQIKRTARIKGLEATLRELGAVVK